MSLLLMMFNMFSEAGAGGPTVAANTNDHVRPRFNAGTAYAVIEFDSDGTEDANNNAITSVLTDAYRGSWLTTGNASDVWIERTINSGSFNLSDAGSGRLQLNSPRKFGVFQSSEGSNTCDVTFDFYDAASGGNLLDSVDILIRAVVSTL